MTTRKQNFQGFSQETIKFFRDLKANNNKAWFEMNRATFEQSVLKPFRALVEDLAPFMTMLDPQLDTRAQVNRTIAKIYRDTRFSKDKSMFRDHLWLVFRRHQGSLSDEACYYFELQADLFTYGMGFYSAPREMMVSLRNRIVANPTKFLKIANHPVLQENFQLHRQYYSRSPVKDFPPEVTDWVKCRTFYYNRQQENEQVVFSPELVDLLKEGFLILYPMYCTIQNMQPKVKVDFNAGV